MISVREPPFFLRTMGILREIKVVAAMGKDNKTKVIRNIKMFKITSKEALEKIEKEYRQADKSEELIPFAKNTSYSEIAENIVRDREGAWKNPLFLTKTMHRSVIGIRNACKMAGEYLSIMQQSMPLDILSVSACIENNKIALKVLVRAYSDNYNFIGFFNYVGDKPIEYIETEKKKPEGRLVIPDEILNFKYTDAEIEEHDRLFNKQNKILENCDKGHPFLNSIKKYVPQQMPHPKDHMDFIYDLDTVEKQTKTNMPFEQFQAIFREIMTYVNGPEYYSYVNVMLGEAKEEDFMHMLEKYIRENYIKTERFAVEDLDTMLKKLHRSLFQLYIIQDLIDDPQVTDIKITAPDSIRARIKGEAYITNISFIDQNDYERFVNGIAIRNRIKMTVPEQTFTDNSDENYILRFSITAKYVNSVPWPYLHIRKIDRNKPLGKKLIELGMFDEKIRDYLLDCGRTSRGVVFAGPPGSGKTVCLNWFLEEAYEQSAEILVIQENDELFAYRKGVMFQHVVNYSRDQEQAVTLEELGQLALVAGANVFIIGEAKGAEICSAVTLSNSGCRTAITIHSYSSTETIEKMADLMQRGFAKNIVQAMRSLKSFQTIVYLDKFKVKEISEIAGFNEKTQQMEYRYIYRRDLDTTVPRRKGA